MADARRDHPDFDLTRTWSLTPLPALPDESIEAYLRRIGFSEAQLQYARRSWGNAACESLANISARAALEEMGIFDVPGLPSEGQGDFRILDGYDRIHVWLAEGLDICLSTPVAAVEWGASPIRVHTANGQAFTADHVLITLPLGVLQARRVRFLPELPAWKRDAVDGLRMGPGLKLVYRFAQPILPESVAAVYSALNPPMWWTPSYGRSLNGRGQVWMAFATGDWARDLLGEGEAQALEKALDTLRTELGQPHLQPETMQIVNWTADEYALGAYSVVPPKGYGLRERLAAPVEDRLFWAGEATAPNPWAATVHGALYSGQRAAAEIVGTAAT